MSWSISHEPNHPWAPNRRTQTRPETTGDTENGSSMKAISGALPGNWNLDIAQAAATPKMVFSGTDIAATSNVSLIAERASGSVTAAAHAPAPALKASLITAQSGRSSISAM